MSRILLRSLIYRTTGYLLNLQPVSLSFFAAVFVELLFRLEHYKNRKPDLLLTLPLKLGASFVLSVDVIRISPMIPRANFQADSL